MRRSLLATVLLTAFAGAMVCSGDQPDGTGTPDATKKGRLAHSHHLGPMLATDTMSGCVAGAPLVKVLISIDPKDKCVPEVTPGSVCVAPGGVVRFRIQNNCEPKTPFEITQPEFRRPLKPADERIPTASSMPGAQSQRSIFENCTLRVPAVASHFIHCDVPEDAPPGFYRYKLRGGVTLDPDVEVHQ